MDSLNVSERDWQGVSRQVRQRSTEERRKNEQLARQLSHEAMQHWQRTIEGLLALPTATALGIASSTLYIAAFVERGFEVLQHSSEALRSGAEQLRRDMREAEHGAAGGEERGDGGRARAETNRGEAHA
jgi:hypothetical protein